MKQPTTAQKTLKYKDTIEAMIAGLVKSANRLSFDSEALRDENLVLRAQLGRERAKNAGVTNELIKGSKRNG
jgi:hypothetical protein